MLRLVKSVEERPEHSTVINWTVPVYIKNGEDYYKVCFDIKRKPLPDGTLPLTDEEKHEFSNKFLKHTNLIYFFMVIEDKIHMRFLNGIYDNVCDNYKAILWLADRFELTSNN